MVDNILLLGDSHAHIFKLVDKADHANDETLLVIHSPQLAKHFTRETDQWIRTRDNTWQPAQIWSSTHPLQEWRYEKVRCRALASL